MGLSYNVSAAAWAVCACYMRDNLCALCCVCACSSLVPSVFLHMFLMFGPALVLGGMPQRVSALVTLLTGPIAAARIIGNSERVQLYEWAPIW